MKDKSYWMSLVKINVIRIAGKADSFDELMSELREARITSEDLHELGFYWALCLYGHAANSIILFADREDAVDEMKTCMSIFSLQNKKQVVEEYIHPDDNLAWVETKSDDLKWEAAIYPI